MRGGVLAAAYLCGRAMQESPGAAATAVIPPGSTSPDIQVDTFISATRLPSAQIQFKVSENGQLDWDSETCPVKSLRLSEDCHTCNCVLGFGKGANTLSLSVIKYVQPGQEIKIWFTEEALAAMEIPFLNPVNIRGEKTYACHRCNKKFEYPNPLKLHLALDCDREGLSELWRRLGAGCRGRRRAPVSSAHLPLPLDPKVPPHGEGMSTPGGGNRPLSAFRPYLCSAPGRLPPTVVGGLLTTEDVRIEKEAYLDRRAAEIETLVSNMGQSKQGHLCLYCGKIYSRKYGLKIHIRTHTGFKPLKCKYCFRPFGDPSNLNKHVRLHAESETPYKCEQCGKMLVRRRDLERHIKSRHRTDNSLTDLL